MRKEEISAIGRTHNRRLCLIGVMTLALAVIQLYMSRLSRGATGRSDCPPN
jgi:hypothetical protein